MPTSNRGDDIECICGDSPADNVGGKSEKNEANRLQKLEKEVCRLRIELERIRRQRVAAETAIQRAIVRGENMLGGRYKILVPDDSYDDGDGRGARKKDEKWATSSEARAHDRTDPLSKKDKDCGQYTIG